jgi:citrate synthase
MRRELGQARLAAFAELPRWLEAARGRPLGDAVRLCLAALPDDSAPAMIAAALPVGVAALLRQRSGIAPVAPDPGLTVAADFLRMLRG